MGREVSGATDLSLYPELRVRKNSGTKKIRRVSSLVGFSPDLIYGVFNNSLNNACASVVQRMLRVKGKDGSLVLPPKPIENGFNTRLAKVAKFFDKESFTTAPLTQEQFLASYKGRKRTIYQNAFDTLVSKPLRKKDSTVRWFLKYEKLPFTQEKEPVPRGISPRNPRYHVVVGPYVKRIEKEIYDVIARLFGGTTVFKGLNAMQRGREMKQIWDQFQDPVAVGLDASRFDQHVSKQALEWEHSIYRKYFPHDKLFAKLLKWQLSNKCVADIPEAHLNFKLEGRRMSGDMNTSLGNCLLMCSMMYAYMDGRVDRFRLANDGDDCVLVFERKQLDKLDQLPDWFTEMGFNMKVEEPVFHLEQIEFCQCRPVFTGSEYIMVRNPHTALAKDCVSLTALDLPHLVKRWCKAIGDGGLAGTGGIPVWQEFYKRLLLEAGDSKPLHDDQMWGFNQLMSGMKRTYQNEISPETRHSFWLAFDIEPDRQIQLESEFRLRKFNMSFSSNNTPIRDLPL